MSELYCKFQIPASNTVGGVAETETVLQSVTDGRTYVRIRVKLYTPPHFMAEHKNHDNRFLQLMNLP